ncbi:hypothetical protein, partial [Okeania hirsuta]|uniref:hypothetical protein n=1 Tax=Okeania hirsuta TaxID=1458930 RepID=UPI00195FAA07
MAEKPLEPFASAIPIFGLQGSTLKGNGIGANLMGLLQGFLDGNFKYGQIFWQLEEKGNVPAVIDKRTQLKVGSFHVLLS